MGRPRWGRSSNLAAQFGLEAGVLYVGVHGSRKNDDDGVVVGWRRLATILY